MSSFGCFSLFSKQTSSCVFQVPISLFCHFYSKNHSVCCQLFQMKSYKHNAILGTFWKLRKFYSWANVIFKKCFIFNFFFYPWKYCLVFSGQNITTGKPGKFRKNINLWKLWKKWYKLIFLYLLNITKVFESERWRKNRQISYNYIFTESKFDRKLKLLKLLIIEG